MSILDEIQESLSNFLIEKVKVDTEEPKRMELGDPILDHLLFGGGFPIGVIMMITGHPGSFKSTFAASIATIFKNKGGTVIYLDSENSTTAERLAMIGLTGVKPMTGITVEKINNIIVGIDQYKESHKEHREVPVLIIWDSLAATPCEAELSLLSPEDINKTLGLRARILSSMIPRWIGNKYLSKNKITLLIINQLRDKLNIGITQPSISLKNLSYDKTIPGGNTIMYLTNVLIEHKVRQNFEFDQYDFQGSLVELKIVKNKHFVDRGIINIIIDSIKGYNQIHTALLFLKKHGIVQTKKPRLHFLPSNKLFTTKSLKKELEEDPNFREAFNEALLKKVLEVKESYLKPDSEFVEEDFSNLNN